MDITYHPKDNGAWTELELPGSIPGKSQYSTEKYRHELAIVTFGSRTIVGFIRFREGDLYVQKACDLMVQPMMGPQQNIVGVQVRVLPYLISGLATLQLTGSHCIAEIASFDAPFREMLMKNYRAHVDPPKIELPPGLILP
jgi:hypothetical protein